MKKNLKAFFKHPWLIIISCIAVSGALGFFIKDLTLDNSLRQFFPQKDISYVRLQKTEEQFGSMLALGISLDAGSSTILTPEYIDVVRKISDRVLEIPDVEELDSLTHIDFVCDQDGSISATQLIPETYTGSAEDIAQLKQRLSEWSDMYNRVIINDDNSATQMQISLKPKSDVQAEFDTAAEALNEAKAALKNAMSSSVSAEELEAIKQNLTDAKAAMKAAKKDLRNSAPDSVRLQKILDEVRKITEEECAGHSLKYKLFGEPVISENGRTYMLSDLMRLIPLVGIVVLISLYFSFKTLDGTLLPLLTVFMSAAMTCGIMGLLGITFTLVSSVIPVALIAVGSAYGIHVLTHYYVALDSVEGEMTKELYEDAIFSGLEEVFFAVMLAGLTTVVGFISLVTSPIGPLHSFSIFAALGVLFSLILSVTFIPAVLLVQPYKARGKKARLEHMTEKVKEKLAKTLKRRGGKSIDEASGDTLYLIYKFFCGTVARLAVTSIVIVVLSVWGLRCLKIDTALISYFPKESKMRQDIEYVDKSFAGTNSIFFLISGEEKGSITNPELLEAVDNMQSYLLNKYDGIGKIVSLTTFIKRINQVWHVPGTPQSFAAAAQNDSDSIGEFSSFGDDSFSSFGDESFSSFGDETDGAANGAAVSDDYSDSADNFTDPNIIYSQRLAETMTTEQMLDWLSQAYIAAGGKYATVEKVIDYLMKQINYNGSAYYEIPYDPSKYPVATRQELSGVVNGYLTLLSGSLGRFIDDDLSPSTMRVTCQLRNHSTEISGEIINDVKKYAAEHFPEGYTIELTGSGEMEYTMSDMIITSQFTSLIVSIASVFIIITVSFKSVRAGLLGAIPLIFAILINYMIMGFAGINLDFITSIIASLAVGVGIDYTIHFLSTYKEERSKTDDLIKVTRRTFRKSGHGIVTNALAVGLGFLVLALSKFIVLRYIGILVAIVMFTSSFLAMTIIPGILNASDPKFIRPKEKRENL